MSPVQAALAVQAALVLPAELAVLAVPTVSTVQAGLKLPVLPATMEWFLLVTVKILKKAMRTSKQR